MVFTYPDPMDKELHILRFDAPIVIKRDAFNVTHIYHGNDHSASCRKVYVSKLRLTFQFAKTSVYYGTITFPMWFGTLGGRWFRAQHTFETQSEAFEWLDADVIPSW